MNCYKTKILVINRRKKVIGGGINSSPLSLVEYILQQTFEISETGYS
jgi:hypothetical protein